MRAPQYIQLFVLLLLINGETKAQEPDSSRQSSDEQVILNDTSSGKEISDSLVKSVTNTVDELKSGIINKFPEQELKQEINSAITASTWEEFKNNTELWKKCGLTAGDIIPNVPKPSSVFNLSSSGSASLETQYNRIANPGFSYAPQGWYSILSASNTFKVASIPFSISGSAMFQNGKVNWTYSTGNLSFDYQKLLESFKEKLTSHQLLEQFKQIPQLPTGVLDSLGQFDEVLKTVNDSLNIAEYINAKKILDSLESSLKSTALSKADSLESSLKSAALSKADSLLIDSLQKVKETYEKAEAFYNRVFTLYQTYDDKLQQIREKLEGIKNTKQELEQLADPNELLHRVKSDSLLSKKERILSSIKQFSIGTGTISISPLTVQDFLFKGINAEVFSKDFYFAGGGGFMQSFPLPFSSGLFQENLFNRSVGYITVGEGTPDTSFTHFSAIYLHDDPSSNKDSVSYWIPKTDWIGSARRRMFLGKDYSVYTEWDYSSLRIQNTAGESSFGSSDQIGKQILNRSAAEVSFRRELKEDHASIMIRYIGPWYITLGNLMFIPNLLHEEIEYGLKEFDDRLEATIAAYHEQPVNTEITGYHSHHWGVKANVQYHFPSSGSFVGLQWAPTQVQTTPYSVSPSSSIYNQLSINSLLNYTVFGIRTSTFTDLGACFSQLDYGEISNTSRLFTGSIMQQVLLGKQQLSLQCYGIKNVASVFEMAQLMSQLTDCIQLKKLSITVGSNYTYSSTVPALVGGVVGGSFNVGKAGSFSVNANVRASVSNSVISLQNGQQYLSAIWQVNW